MAGYAIGKDYGSHMLGKRYRVCRRWRRLGKDSYSDGENYRHSRELESVHARDHTPEQLLWRLVFRG